MVVGGGAGRTMEKGASRVSRTPGGRKEKTELSENFSSFLFEFVNHINNVIVICAS